jgi:putative FmdB family regulatory protein
MPTYDYECKCCGRLQRFSSIQDRDSQFCSCGRKLTRVLSRPTILIPNSFHTSWSDVLGTEDEQAQLIR